MWGDGGPRLCVCVCVCVCVSCVCVCRVCVVQTQGMFSNAETVAFFPCAQVPEKRLATARLLVSQVGMSRKMSTASKIAEAGITNAAAALEAGLTGENEQFHQSSGPIEREVYTSPNILQPVVRAIEAQCLNPESARAFAAAVCGLRFEMSAPHTTKSLVSA